MPRKAGRSKTALNNIGTSYTSSIKVELPVSPKGAVFIGDVSLIKVQSTDLSDSNTPTELTICVSEDQEGDQFVLTETTSKIQSGITTPSKGTALWLMNATVALDLFLNDEVYVWLKTNKGTLNIPVEGVVISYSGDR